MSELLESINRDFEDFLYELDKEEGLAKNMVIKLQEDYIKRGCLIGDKPFPTFLKPFFLTPQMEKKAIKVSNLLMSAMEKITDLYFQDGKYKRLFELLPEEAELTEIYPGFKRKIWITRNDSIMTEEYLQFIEFNTDTCGGPMYSDIQAELLEETPIIKKLKEHYQLKTYRFMPKVLEALLTAYREFGGKKEKPTICIVAGREGATTPEFRLIIEWLTKLGYPAMLADPRDLDYDGKNVHLNGKPIDLIYLRGWLRDWTDHMAEIKPLIKGFRELKVCVVNPPRSILGTNKSLIGVMQKEEFKSLFTDEELEVIHRNMPWTRLVAEIKETYKGKSIDLLPFIRKNREKLVLKPIDLYGGKDVIIGLEVSDSEWEKWINTALSRKFVVQEYVPIPLISLPVVEEGLKFVDKKANANFFCFQGIYAGGFSRSSEQSVINISAGGGLVPMMVVLKKKK